MSFLLESYRFLRNQYPRPFFALIIVLALLICLDFALRISVLRDSSARVFSTPASAAVKPLEGAESALKRLEAWIPAPVVVEAPPAEREIVLQGIFGTGKEAKAAIALVSLGGGPVERLRATIGQEFDGWTVQHIGSGKVILKKGEETRELVLFRPKTG